MSSSVNTSIIGSYTVYILYFHLFPANASILQSNNITSKVSDENTNMSHNHGRNTKTNDIKMTSHIYALPDTELS